MSLTVGCLGKIPYATRADAVGGKRRSTLQSTGLRPARKESRPCLETRPSRARRAFSERSMATRNPIGGIAVSEEAARRYWTLVDTSNGPEGCWTWMGPRHRTGVGRFWDGSAYVLAARVAYALGRQRDPGTLAVRRSCEAAGCLNPAHLYTRGDNHGTRRCITCAERKGVGEFYVRSDGSLLSECRPCSRRRSDAWVDPSPEQSRITAMENLRRSRRELPIRTMLCSAKQRAKAKGLPFAITADDVPIPSHCPVLGIPLRSRLGTGEKASGAWGNSPSLDRVVNERGYVPGNVIVVSWRANRIKVDATVEELEAVARFYRRLKDERQEPPE